MSDDWLPRPKGHHSIQPRKALGKWERADGTEMPIRWRTYGPGEVVREHRILYSAVLACSPWDACGHRRKPATKLVELIDGREVEIDIRKAKVRLARMLAVRD